ncbi:glycosyltransferase [Deinococcus puniceus]|uniref:Family 2 glycosyl transferase n=1 Tax=Deinococcus puniceus TaxID=1182568 RepID=A0A172T6M3_9DEIO|nr:glycosyltransferase [Deinococcus puniceus]ANE42586.1 family 2 glycosyl transferase [Deinococcus puniceus]
MGFIVSKLVVMAVNAVTFPRLRPRPLPAGGPRVSILIPARNEAHNLPRTLPGVLAQGAHEVLILDDHSTDGTGELACRLGARVIRGEDLPEGWFGKPWACDQLARAATGDILIFTDADVTWGPGALGAVVHQLEASGADLLSALPRQDNQTPGERLLTPLVDLVVLSYLPYPVLKLPFPAASAANGQLMAFRRDTFERAGGYRLVRNEVLEDTLLASRLKAQGGRLAMALGGDCIGVRMYSSYPESVRGFGKNSLPLHLNSRALMTVALAGHLAVYTLPWLLPSSSSGGAALRLLRFAGLLERPLTNLITGRRKPADLAEGLLGPLTPLLALPVYLRAMRRRVTWKGRAYKQ